MTSKHNAAIELATELFPLIEMHARTHGADRAVVEGLWALANLAAFLICSPGINRDKARCGFIKALDLSIEEELVDFDTGEKTKH